MRRLGVKGIFLIRKKQVKHFLREKATEGPGRALIFFSGASFIFRSNLCVVNTESAWKMWDTILFSPLKYELFPH